MWILYFIWINIWRFLATTQWNVDKMNRFNKWKDPMFAFESAEYANGARIVNRKAVHIVVWVANTNGIFGLAGWEKRYS